MDLSGLDVTDPLYKLLTQPSVLQLGISSANIDVAKILFEAYESPLAVRLDGAFAR